MQLIPALIIVSHPTIYPHAEAYFYACCLTAFTIPLGGMITNWLMDRPQKTQSVFDIHNHLPDTVQSKKTRHFIYALSAIALLVFIAFLSHAPTSPILLFLSGDTTFSTTLALREDILNMGYLYGFARTFFFPFLFTLFLYYWRHYKSLSFTAFSFVMCGIIFLYAAYPSTKADTAMLFLLAMFSCALFYKDIFSQHNFKNILRVLWIPIALFLCLLLYPIIVYSINGVGSVLNLWEIFMQGIVMRIFYNPAVNAYYAFTLFPDPLPFTYFRDVGKIALLMGWEQYPLNQQVAIARHGIISSSPPPSIGVFYAQGGWVLVVLGPLFAASIFKVVENILLSARRAGVVEFALYTILFYGAFRFSWAYFHSILLTECLVPICIVWGVWQIYKMTDNKNCAKITSS